MNELTCFECNTEMKELHNMESYDHHNSVSYLTCPVCGARGSKHIDGHSGVVTISWYPSRCEI